MRIELTPAYILHQRAYRDTSLIVDFFSREYGVVSAVAKGAKRPKSSFRGSLQSFTPLLASWVGSRELVTLTQLDVEHFTPRLSGNYLVAGFYLNEILLRLLPRVEPFEQLYDIYHHTLNELLQGEIEDALRQFELVLLRELGYGLLLECDADSGDAIDPDAFYLYVFEHGPVKVDMKPGLPGLILKGETLKALAANSLQTSEQRRQARVLVRQAIKPLLGNKPLQSRELWRIDKASAD